MGKTIAIMGASGFVGRNLAEHFLEQTDYAVRALCPNPESLARYNSFGNRFFAPKSDVFDYELVKSQLLGVDAAYYLVHMMAQKSGDFYELEAKAAQAFGRAAKDGGVRRVIYMSGLGDDREKLSKHLKSRHNTGDILRTLVSEVIEFRASMIIGTGSISFDIVKNLVRKLPIMILPYWSKTKTQPIGLLDALRYLMAAADIKIQKHEIVEIGGPEAMSYKDFIKYYAASRGKRPLLIRLPVLFGGLAAWWLNLFISKEHAKVGIIMVESFKNEMIVTNNRAKELFPEIHPKSVREYFNS